jgi:hypothetical protein
MSRVDTWRPCAVDVSIYLALDILLWLLYLYERKSKTAMLPSVIGGCYAVTVSYQVVFKNPGHSL